MTQARPGALLLLNGELRRPELVKAIARESIVICADGGMRHAVELGIEPRIVIGDMDSLPRRLPHWTRVTYVCDFDEDLSDFEKALRLLAGSRWRRAAKRTLGAARGGAVWIAGASGGRLDHALVNSAIMERYGSQLNLALIDAPNARVLGPGRHTLPARPGQSVSLLSAGAACRVTTKGLKHPLAGETLKRGSRGLSNVATAPRIEVRVHSGRVWVFG